MSDFTKIQSFYAVWAVYQYGHAVWVRGILDMPKGVENDDE